MKINPKIAKTPQDLQQLEFKKMKLLIKKELARLEKNTTKESPTQCMLIGDFNYVDKPGMALPLFGAWKGLWKDFAKKEVAVKEQLGAIGSVYFGGIDAAGQKIVQIDLSKGKGKTKVAKIQKTLKKLIPQATYNVVFGEISEQALEQLEEKLEAAPEVEEVFEEPTAEEVVDATVENSQDSRILLVSNFKELITIFNEVKNVILPRIRSKQTQEDDMDIIVDMTDLANEWLGIYGTAATPVQQAFLEQKQQVDKLLEFVNQIDSKLKTTDTPESNPTPTSDDKTFETAKKAAELGQKMKDEPQYQVGYAYIKFTGKATGTAYKPGDMIAEADKIANYGSKNRPTWCNQFMYDISEELLGNANPFDMLPMGKGWTNANVVTQFFQKADGVLVDKISGEGRYAKAWEQINKGKMVYFCRDKEGGIGHVSTGVPTPNLRPSKHAPNDMVGRITQAGSKVGEFWIDEIWQKTLGEVEIFVGRFNEKLPNDAKPDPNLHLAIYNKITHPIGQGKVMGSISSLQGKYKASELQDVIGSIRAVQQLLINAGQSIGKKGVDGDCGNSTVIALQNIQREISATETGYVEMDDATWNYLKGKSQPLIDKALASVQAQKTETTLRPENVKFQLKGTATALNAKADAVLRDILAKADEANPVIVNTLRTAEQQASMMYLNIKAYGAEFNRKKYKNPTLASQVVDAYLTALAAGKNEQEIIGAMLLIINQIGAANLSDHCNATNPAIDIHPSSLKNKSIFEKIIKSDTRVSVICPPADTTYHIVVK